MVDFSNDARNSGSSMPLKDTRLVVGESEILIAIDKDTQAKIVTQLFKTYSSTHYNPEMLEILSSDKDLLKLLQGRAIRQKAWVHDAFPQLAIIPAGLGMLAASLEHFVSSMHTNDLLSKLAGFLPIIVACSVALSNFVVLYRREHS